MIAGHSGWRRWLGFTAMSLGMFLAILDIQIVASSLVGIQVDLGIPSNRLSYLQTTYLIAEVIAIALSGWLMRALSTRWLFVGCMLGFVAASAACAMSHDYVVLYIWRFIQGLFGGAIIPLIFSAAFLMFPPERQTLATVIGGGFAMLAPSVGPFIGGWITETLSWHWLFLVNIFPGILVAAIVAATVKVDQPKLALLKAIDIPSLVLIAIFLATLELALKEGPHLGWLSSMPLVFAAICLSSGAVGFHRCWRKPASLVDLRVFGTRSFAVGAWFSFVLGVALFGSLYLLPLFLGFVRDHGPLEIGTIMIVAGIAQLISAPFATWLEHRISTGLLLSLGYAMLALGLAWNGFADTTWDFRELFIPQLLRGVAIMLCLLPATRLALGHLAENDICNGSALFNLMRNIGGAVGLALIDSVIENRPAHHAARLIAKLEAGDRATAAFVGLPLERFHGTPMGPIDQATKDFIGPLVERAALTASFNDAWLLLGGLAALSIMALPLAKRAAAPTAPHSRP